MQFNEILLQTVKRGASDVHLKHGLKPIVRRNGNLELLSAESERMTGEQIRDMAYSIMTPAQRALFEINHELDLSYGLTGIGRFRVNVFMQRGTPRMVVRTISQQVPSFNELHLPKVIEKIAGFERGLILVTGVTGSGKSTTMASMVEYINQTKNKHILTIEDPIEYIIHDKKSVISQRELGTDTLSFASAVRAALRQDPDVILIGEIRDRETMDIALLAAETGHLVISTLHTADAKETINRILVYYEPHHQQQIRAQLAACLKAVISQRLATRADAQGLVPAMEIMLNTIRVRDMILNPEKTQEITHAIEEGHVSFGMQSFDQSLMQLLTDKIIDYPEALQLSTHPEDFSLRVKGVKSADGERFRGFDKSGQDIDHWTEMPQVELDKVEKQLKDDRAEKADKTDKADKKKKK